MIINNSDNTINNSNNIEYDLWLNSHAYAEWLLPGCFSSGLNHRMALVGRDLKDPASAVPLVPLIRLCASYRGVMDLGIVWRHENKMNFIFNSFTDFFHLPPVGA